MRAEKKIKNPLRKRVVREIRQDLGKNLAIFLFIAVTIGFMSGFLVADDSLKAAYDESFEKYNIEDGNFEVSEMLTDEEKRELEEEVTIYDNFYVEKEVKENNKIRIFINRTDINLVCIMKGRAPERENEIAIDRLYAEKNGFKIGDSINAGGDTLKITGLAALSDYSALFNDNNDLMFDATMFGVGVVTEEQFENYMEGKVHFSYSWEIAEDGLGETEKDKINDNLMRKLVSTSELVSFLAEKDNQAIHFTGDDMGGDKSMMIVLLYILMVILAFIFAVTTMSTIDKESAVIGTLRASGYTRGEIIRHYMITPVIITFFASVIGNIMGYTFLKKTMAGLYYNSYSLTSFDTLWNGNAFIQTTVVPCVIMFVVNLAVIWKKMKLSPLKFLRHDVRKNKNSKAVRLPAVSFMSRFKIRIILQNLSNYFMLFIGIQFANLILLFGLMITPLLDHYSDEVIENMKGEYQYILKTGVETETEGVEKCAVNSMIFENGDNAKKDEILVYGIQDNSKYFKDLKLMNKKNEVVVSESILEKYKLKAGDTIKLKSEFTEEQYEFTIAKSYYFPQGLTVFMSSEMFEQNFDVPDGYFNSYISDNKIEDIDEKMILTVITKSDLLKVSRQLKDSFGGMAPLIAGFTVIMSMLIIYLLSKVVIEKNSTSISMVKILGYNNREISRLYVEATGIVAVISALLSLPLSNLCMKNLFHIMLASMSGWVSYYVNPKVFVEIFVLSILAYIIVAGILFKKVKKIPMEQVLKSAE